MIAVVLVTEAEQTQRALTALILLLLVVAAMLALLTLWYWRHTDPRRHVRRVLPELDEQADLRHQQGYVDAGLHRNPQPSYGGDDGQPFVPRNGGHPYDGHDWDPYRPDRRHRT